MNKKGTRTAFRSAVFERDKYRCLCCGKKGKDRQGGDGWKKFHAREEGLCLLDAHHISPREQMPEGGYVKENGVTVCEECHIKAEACLASLWSGVKHEGFMPEDLYQLIGSDREKAIRASQALR